jgi:hypothetical protein
MAPASDADASEGEDAPLTGDAEAEGDAEPEQEVKYKPLDEELREEIRDELARSKALGTAQREMDRVLAEIRKVVEDYGKDLRVAYVNEEGAEPDEVESFDESNAFDIQDLSGMLKPELRPLVAEPLIEMDQTPRVDALSVQELEIGRAYDQVEFAWPPQRQSFADIAFEDNEPLYRPARIRGELRNRYFLFWKIAQQEAYAPELDSIRDEVVDAWKMRAAVAEAEKAAGEMVGKLGKDVVLQDVVQESLGPDAEVIETNEFSWMSTGLSAAGMGQPGLSNIEGVEGGDNDFMKSVFALQVGEAGFAVNQPETMVYVVRIISDAPGDEELRQRFLESGSSFEVQRIASADGQSFVREWFEDMEKDMDVEWLRDPQIY